MNTRCLEEGFADRTKSHRTVTYCSCASAVASTPSDVSNDVVSSSLARIKFDSSESGPVEDDALGRKTRCFRGFFLNDPDGLILMLLFPSDGSSESSKGL